MRWEKKNPSFTTIEQVIEYNSGTTVQELLFSQENDEDPYLFGLDQCVNVVRNCIEKGMEISVVGDYDADGVTSTTILSLGLEEITGKSQRFIFLNGFQKDMDSTFPLLIKSHLTA